MLTVIVNFSGTGYRGEGLELRGATRGWSVGALDRVMRCFFLDFEG